GGDSAYPLLARAMHELHKPDEEIAAIRKWVTVDPEASEGLLRLIELFSERNDWKEAAKYADRLMAVNPLIPPPHRALARSREELGELSKAIRHYRTLLLLNPPDLAEVHYRLANNLHKQKAPDAKLHLL